MKQLSAVLESLFADGHERRYPSPSRMAPEYGVYMSLGPMVDDVRDGANLELLEREAQLATEGIDPNVTVPRYDAAVLPAYDAAREEAEAPRPAAPQRTETDVHLQAVIASRSEAIVAMRHHHRSAIAAQNEAASRKKWTWQSGPSGHAEEAEAVA